MYRKPTDKQRRRLEAMKLGRQRAAMARDPSGRMPELPQLRRELTVIDYDSGSPVAHTLHLYLSDRVDCYRAVADGKPWKDRIGWSRVLVGMRKSFQRVPGKRSDFWH